MGRPWETQDNRSLLPRNLRATILHQRSLSVPLTHQSTCRLDISDSCTSQRTLLWPCGLSRKTGMFPLSVLIGVGVNAGYRFSIAPGQPPMRSVLSKPFWTPSWPPIGTMKFVCGPLLKAFRQTRPQETVRVRRQIKDLYSRIDTLETLFKAPTGDE